MGHEIIMDAHYEVTKQQQQRRSPSPPVPEATNQDVLDAQELWGATAASTADLLLDSELTDAPSGRCDLYIKVIREAAFIEIYLWTVVTAAVFLAPLVVDARGLEVGWITLGLSYGCLFFALVAHLFTADMRAFWALLATMTIALVATPCVLDTTAVLSFVLMIWSASWVVLLSVIRMHNELDMRKVRIALIVVPACVWIATLVQYNIGDIEWIPEAIAALIASPLIILRYFWLLHCKTTNDYRIDEAEKAWRALYEPSIALNLFHSISASLRPKTQTTATINDSNATDDNKDYDML